MRNRASRALAVAAAAAALGMVAAGCGGDDGDSTAEGGGSESLDLTVGVLLPMTGTSSAFGPPLEKATKMAVQQVNDAAKKAGVDLRVEVVTADNESEPVASVAAARKLVTEGASCIVGSSSSATTIAVAQSVAIPQGVPMISPMSTAASITDLHANGGVTFRTIPADPMQAKVLADVIAERLDGAEGKTISIAGRDDAFGQGLTAEIKRNWEELGGQATGPLLYDPNASSYNGVAGQIVDGDPAAYVIIDLPQTYAKVGAALLRTGKFSADDLFIGGGQPATIPEDTPPEALNGAVGASPGFPTDGPLVEAFNALWDRSPGVEQQQPYMQNGFDATMLCALGAVAAQSTDGRAIAEELIAPSTPGGPEYSYQELDQAIADLGAGKDVDFQGVSGPLDLDDNGDVQAGYVNVYRYIDGKLTVERQVQAGD
jgi:ABC-type branched-subunit amino acid transport system substrate-binding protein